ncbi:MAG TPA: Bax inhibitor-1 family protein [Oligoflexia bacterium]|nr:Bax inhibitor-1 family protein [Oligoflexia bacterium]HMR24662.1 Bax inhibitor-1 family protein [Oligoflexia bacterium]
MLSVLFVKVFSLLGGMLLVTAAMAKINKAYETKAEFIGTILLSFILLFLVVGFSDHYPINIIMVALFSAVVGWSVGPSITHLSIRYERNKFLKERGIAKEDIHTLSPEIQLELDTRIQNPQYKEQWQKIVNKAILGVALSVILTAAIVYLSPVDFGYLGGFLLISLILLIVMGLANVFYFKSERLSLIKSYIGALIFIIYLLYDFNQLEKLHALGETSWQAAIDVAVNIYLDMINLFLDLLEILADSD